MEGTLFCFGKERCTITMTTSLLKINADTDLGHAIPNNVTAVKRSEDEGVSLSVLLVY